ncbi:MAG: tRNA lysidine(34) synthetase TilS [Acidobacteria bacterium]|nr:tRNA lysidine(34) synthetase TilS [Acidobacteriota bacterium]
MAALSGGSDSVAQLLALHDLAAAGELVLAGAAHLNHQLRPEAVRDEAFCRDLCARLDVPLVVEAVPVADLAAEAQVSIEVAARRARYAFLERARTSRGAAVVAVAHTADDQAETVLLRLLRGAGPRGLRGILPVRGTVVRPLLDCTRVALRADLERRGQTWVEDATNADVMQPRNRVRHELMPLLAARFQPAVTRVLARTAEVVAADDALLESLADAAASGVVTLAPRGTVISTVALERLPLALARRVVRRAMERLAPPHAPDLADIEALRAVCRPGGPPAATPAGLRVERFSEDAVLLTREAGTIAAALPSRALPVPGSVALPELGSGCRLTAERPIKALEEPADLRRRLIMKATVPLPLVVRGRSAGDRIRPRGLGGSKKLQDLLVDRKVPRAERERVPVVADATGRIVWVVGHAVDADVAPSGGDDDVIVLTFDQPAPSGSEGS